MGRCAVIFCLLLTQCHAHNQLRAEALEGNPNDIPLKISACNYMSPEHIAKHAGASGAKVVVTGKDLEGEFDITDSCHPFKFPQGEWYTSHDPPSMHPGTYLEFHTVAGGQKKLLAQYNLWGPAFDPAIVEKVKMFYLVIGQDHFDEKETAFKLFTSCQDAAWVDVVAATPECKAWAEARCVELGYEPNCKVKAGATTLGAVTAIALAFAAGVF